MRMTATDVLLELVLGKSLPWTPGWAAKSNEENPAALDVVDVVKLKGFFYLSGHGIKQSKINDVYAASKAFHQPATKRTRRNTASIIVGGCRFRNWTV